GEGAAGRGGPKGNRGPAGDRERPGRRLALPRAGGMASAPPLRDGAAAAYLHGGHGQGAREADAGIGKGARGRFAVRSLDDPGVLELDRSGMLGHAAQLGRELIRAWRSAAEWPLPEGASSADGLVVAGMGGSASAGDYVLAVASPTSERP